MGINSPLPISLLHLSLTAQSNPPLLIIFHWWPSPLLPFQPLLISTLLKLSLISYCFVLDVQYQESRNKDASKSKRSPTWSSKLVLRSVGTRSSAIVGFNWVKKLLRKRNKLIWYGTTHPYEFLPPTTHTNFLCTKLIASAVWTKHTLTSSNLWFPFSC